MNPPSRRPREKGRVTVVVPYIQKKPPAGQAQAHRCLGYNAKYCRPGTEETHTR